MGISLPLASCFITVQYSIRRSRGMHQSRCWRSRTERVNMKLSEYFEQAKGVGVLATTDLAGQINQAIYAKPLFLDKDDDGTCSFVMANRLTHDNVRHNPSASYLFIEQGEDYVGKRLSLVVIEEEHTPEKISCTALGINEEDSKYLVHFHIEGVRPLIGNE
jgi:hypothetical protein